MPLMNPLATAGAAPSTIIRMIAFQVTPKTMMAERVPQHRRHGLHAGDQGADAGPQHRDPGHRGADDPADDDHQYVPDDRLLGGHPAGLPEQRGAEKVPQLTEGGGRRLQDVRLPVDPDGDLPDQAG